MSVCHSGACALQSPGALRVAIATVRFGKLIRRSWEAKALTDAICGLRTLTVKLWILPGEKLVRAAGKFVSARHFTLLQLNVSE
jgi:hypothetical protein